MELMHQWTYFTTTWHNNLDGGEQFALLSFMMHNLVIKNLNHDQIIDEKILNDYIVIVTANIIVWKY